MNRNIIRLVILLAVLNPFWAGYAYSAQIQWHSFESGMARGKFEKKNVFVNFYADWCAFCKEMDRTTFKDPSVISYLNENFIAVKVNTDREQQTASMFRVQGLPDSWFFSKQGDVIGHRPGFIPPEDLLTILKSIVSDSQ
jgi:thiol:disulfide interchange protein